MDSEKTADYLLGSTGLPPMSAFL
ncbi:MAG: hypothetical protein RL161_967, partial [Bacteroidota bacterium]